MENNKAFNKDGIDINLEVIKESSNKKKYLICSSAFKMENSYTESDVYTNGLFNILKNFDTNPEKDNIVYRIYYDESIEKSNDKNWIFILKEIKKRKYCELVRYNCPQFKVGIYHYGTFGTFIRYLPLFIKKDWDIFACIDIDNKLPFYDIKKFKKSSNKFYFKSKPCYYLVPHNTISELKTSTRIVGSLVMSKIIFNEKLLLNFLNNIYKKEKDYLIFLNSLNVPYIRGRVKFRYKVSNELPYGVDEFFLNNVILRYLIENNIKYSYIFKQDDYSRALSIILVNNKYFTDIPSNVENFYINFTKKILGKEYNLNKSLEENFKYLIDNTQGYYNEKNVKKADKILNYISLSQFELLKVLKNKKYIEYNIPKNIYKCINLKRPIPLNVDIASSRILDSVNTFNIDNKLIKGGSNNNQNKKKYIIDLICWNIKNCKTRDEWNENWLQYFPNKSLNWDININLNILFPKNKYLDFKSPLEKLYKYYKVDYFKTLLETLNNTTFNLIENIIYIDNNDYELNQILNYYIYNFKNMFILNIWPINKNIFNSKDNFIKVINLLKNNGTIHFIKKIEISQKEALPLFFQLYSDKDGMKDLKSILHKVINCGWKYNKENLNKKENAMAIFYEPFDNNLLSGKDAKLKTEIRLLLTKIDNKNTNNHKLNIKNYLHINDTFSQTLELGSIYLNKTNFDFFNMININKFMKMLNFRGKAMFLIFKKWLHENFETIDLFRVLIFSSYILFLIGLRTPSDLDVIVYHNPIKAKTKSFNKFIEDGAIRGGLFGFLDFTIKGFSEWKDDNSYKNDWFLKEWPNLVGSKGYDDIIFNPRYHINFLGIKIGSLETDLKRREKRSRAPSYADLIAIKYYNIKNIEIPKIPQEYYQNHILKYYKTTDDKKLLFIKIKNILKYRYNIELSLLEIAKYLNENQNNYKLV